MHQQPRQPPRVTSPATSPQTNPTRSNNPREALAARSRTPSDSLQQDRAGGFSGAGSSELPRPGRDNIKKMDQIIQNFFLKAGHVVAGSRTKTTFIEGLKPNLWFAIETQEFEEFRNEFRIWKTCTTYDKPFPPMVIEIYLDASQLSPSQCLVYVDDNDKRWDVLEALNSSESSDDSPTVSARNTELILERWQFEFKPGPFEDFGDFGPTLATIYKKAVITFRSIFATSRICPAYKFAQQSIKEGRPSVLEVKCRVLTGETEATGLDPLRQPLSDARETVTDYVFGDLELPAGRLTASVAYRTECHFKLVDAESLLSSRFTAIDEHFFKPSLPQTRIHGRRESSAEVGSFPSRRREKEPEDVSLAYGSLSTFHGTGAPGTSPITALKALKPPGSDTNSVAGSIPASMEDPPHSLPIRPSLRGKESAGRRASVSFQPFKSGSLSGSPRVNEGEIPASPIVGSRQSGLSALAQARNRNSLTAGMPASLRGGPPPTAAPAGDTPVSSSPRPVGRIGSSFSHRRARPSFGGQSSRAGDDDQASSGRQSLSSSIAQPGSGLLAEAGGQASSGSLNADDDNLSEFLKVLDSRKTLESFEIGKRTESAAKRTAAQLSKFQMMRESNNALTESMTSSMQLQRSLSTSSRNMTSVPGMVAPASMSVSSSPGKPLSPHTPHTPAIPSRLSENSIIDYEAQAQAARRVTRVAPQISSTEEERTDAPSNPEGTTAIDIPLPLSPRLLQQTNRRSSSVAQQQRSLAEVEDSDAPFGSRRSISLGAEREPPTLSALFSMEHEDPTEDLNAIQLQPAAHIRVTGGVAGSPIVSTERDKSSAPRDLLAGGGSVGTSEAPAGRLRYTPRRGRPTPPHSSRGSFVGGGGGSSSSGGRFGAGRGGDNDAEDEPLVFDMQVSELGRRSLEEGRGGGNAGSSSSLGGGDRAHEQRGISKRGW